MSIIVTIFLGFLLSGLYHAVDAAVVNASRLHEAHHPLHQPPTAINSTLKDSARKPKFFSRLSFLTGLGLGSLASAAALGEPSAVPSNSNIFSRYPTTTRSPLHDLPVNFASSELGLPTTQPNVYDPAYPYYIALSTNALLHQSLRSVQRILEQLRTQFSQKEPSEPQNASNSEYDEVEDDETTDVNVYKVKESPGVVNCSSLRELIRASIAEEINRATDLPQRQSRPTNTSSEESGSDESTTAAPTTTAASNATANVTIPTSTQFPGYYYGGHPQNVSGVDLTSAYGPPVYPVYPPHNEVYHGLPSYGPVPFHQEYHPETYEIYSPPSGGNFAGVPDSYHDYSRYARGKKVLNEASGFSPSNFISKI